jgi:cytidylate kinase
VRIDRLVITIDGPSGAGKSTLARLLAERMGVPYLDTGALYRTVAVEVARSRIDMNDDWQLERLCQSLDIRVQWDEGRFRIFSSGRDVSEEIRSESIGQTASLVSARASVRSALLGIQRQFIARTGGVLEGRDTGTVVAPDAPVKFFLDADLEERGRRRLRELQDRGMEAQLESLIQGICQRDRQDRERSLAPLQSARDAVIIDTTGKSIAEVLEEMMEHIRRRLQAEV